MTCSSILFGKHIMNCGIFGTMQKDMESYIDKPAAFETMGVNNHGRDENWQKWFLKEQYK